MPLGIARSNRARLAAAGVVLLATLVAPACTRRVYRTRADREARELVREKSTSPRWAIPDLDVYADPRSRFYDPHDPDRPPKPCDDPESGELMAAVYGPGGMRRWCKDGVTGQPTNPMWLTLLPTYTQMTPDGKINLDLRTANLLGRIHSRDFQRNLEEVYLSSLDVAFERFRFQVQYFGGNDTFFFQSGNEATSVLGRLRQGAPRESQSILDSRWDLGFSRRFAAGGQLIASIANSMVWQFSGPDMNFTTSVINYSFVQPLLQGGGKVVNLETLTRAERSLLANLRSQAYFEQSFYKDIAIGEGTDVEPNRIGGFTGGAGLTGFTGIGAGGFGGVGAGQNFGGFGDRQGGVGGSGAGGGVGLAGGGEGILNGYYGLVQRLQTIRNTEVSLDSQELTLGLLEANFAAGLIDLVQVDEFRQNIETERATLLRARTAYRDALEGYVITRLNLPPTLDWELDQNLIRQFQLIDMQVGQQQQRAAALLREIGELPPEPAIGRIREIADKVVQLNGDATEAFRSVETEIRELLTQREERADEMTDERRRTEFNESLTAVEELITVLSRRLGDVNKEILAFQETLEPGSEKASADRMVELVSELSGVLQEIGLVQARSRVERVTIDPVHLDYPDAMAIARANRLDWMNQRAALVDQWRLVAFNANRLLAGLDIVVEGDLGTVGNNTVRFRGSTGNLAAGVQFDAPLNRKGERNLYRESLIDFQRAKRRYVTYVDTVAFTLRSRLRQLERLAENLEIQRRALVISIRRVDRTLEDLNQPFPTAQPGQPPPQLSPTLSQNLLRALSDLRNTQDNFMSVWLNHEAARINLLLQLGILQMGPDGVLMEVPVGQAMNEVNESPIPAEESDAYLNRLEETTTAGGDIQSAIFDQPDRSLIARVETTVGEKLSDADQAAIRSLVTEEERRAVKREKTPKGMLELLAERFGMEDTPPPIPKGEFPSSLRAFVELRDQKLTDEEISRKAGWTLAAVRAFRDAAELSTQQVVTAIPLRPLVDPATSSVEAGSMANADSLERESSGSEGAPPRIQQADWEGVEVLDEPPKEPNEIPKLGSG